jgi:glucose-6-phosphate isomerase
MIPFQVTPGPLAIAYTRACARLDEIAFANALWTRRLEVWSGDPHTQRLIAHRLGWLQAIDFVEPHVPRLDAVADAIRAEKVSDVVLLGMGGSSLAPEVLRSVLGVAPGYPRFRMLDSVDPDAVRDAMATAESSVFVLASKSGSTIEPNVMAAEARRRLMSAGLAWGTRFIAITDENTELHKRALSEGFREVFVNPADIGGRYSALSFFGMVPAALMGIDVRGMLTRAREMEAACRAPSAAENPGLALGAFMAAGAEARRDKLTLLTPPALTAFGLWVEQLVAESTGKQGKGVVPIAGEAAGPPFGSDRAIVAVTVGGSGLDESVRESVRTARAPLAELEMRDPIDLGAEFLRWEVATAAAGVLLQINPFDEPNVQQAKDATRRLLDAFKRLGRLPISEPLASVGDARLTLSDAAQQELSGADPRDFTRLMRPGDYVGVLAYLPPDDPILGAALRDFRDRLRKAGFATMLGYGPRYLHSTGQLHKGGPNNGVFLVVTAEPDEDLPIPGEPFSFGVLEMAQAAGDFQSLDRVGRRALHVHLPRRDGDLLQRTLAILSERRQP